MSFSQIRLVASWLGQEEHNTAYQAGLAVQHGIEAMLPNVKPTSLSTKWGSHERSGKTWRVITVMASVAQVIAARK